MYFVIRVQRIQGVIHFITTWLLLQYFYIIPFRIDCETMIKSAAKTGKTATQEKDTNI